MPGSKETRLVLFLAVALSTTALPPAAEAQDSGRVGAVNLDATGTPPGAGARVLSIGTNIIYKERILTSASGSAQIILPDTATLNVGRNSSIVIDEYVYDPNAGTGKMVASVSKGLMRFVGGQISHGAGVTVNTPVATLGIRGGVATVIYPVPRDFAGSDPRLAQARGEIVIGHVGSIVIRNNTGSAIVRPGYMTWASGLNAPIPEPFPVPEALLQKVMAALTSGTGQTGGVSDLPTDQMAARLGFGRTIVADPARPPGADPVGYLSIFDGGNAAAKNKSQSRQTGQVQAPPSPAPTVPVGTEADRTGPLAPETSVIALPATGGGGAASSTAGGGGTASSTTGGSGTAASTAGGSGTASPATGGSGTAPPATGGSGTAPPATGGSGTAPPATGGSGTAPPATGGGTAPPATGTGSI